VRRSALISPWGVGATVDFPNDESLMTGGLDAWPNATEECPSDWRVIEERLQKRLGVDYFRLPPDFRTPSRGVRFAAACVPFVRFPQWHYCPICGNMRELGQFSESQRCDGPNYPDGVSCAGRPEKKRSHLIPVRFVVACGTGAHIRDFPIGEWIHRDRPFAPGICRLRLRAGRASAGLSGIKIECSCGATDSMANVFDENALLRIGMRCGGQRPWLGDVAHDEARCGGGLTVLQRGASNVYFAHVASSIYLPLWAEATTRPVIEALEEPDFWRALSSGLVDGRIDLMRCEILCSSQSWRGLDAEELQQAAQRKIEGRSAEDTNDSPNSPEMEEEMYRQAEYDALRTGRGSIDSDLATDVVQASAYGDPISTFFHSITLVKKLRETRALYGFSRCLPDDPRGYAEQREALRLDPQVNWLPAIVVRGEGIFFNLDAAELDDWAKRTGVGRRLEILGVTYNQKRRERQRPTRSIPTKFLLLHTLAHLIINQLSYDCGYGSSSLRERIYCDTGHAKHPMHGFLIYTASGDAEGTMGGLVRQGKPGRLEDTLLRALRRAEWCSYDPICMESPGQGPDSCNLAACHGCALLPETSCEEGNRLLDRAAVVGLPDVPEVGLFGKHLQELLRETVDSL